MERPASGSLKSLATNSRGSLAVAELGFKGIGGKGAVNDRFEYVFVLLGRQCGGMGIYQFGSDGAALLVVEEKVLIGSSVVEVPGVVGGAGNEGLDEVDAEKAEEVDERSDERNNGNNFGKGNDVEGRGGSDLVAPAVEEVVSNREEEGEENGVG